MSASPDTPPAPADPADQSAESSSPASPESRVAALRASLDHVASAMEMAERAVAGAVDRMAGDHPNQDSSG
ncbi:MAG TPA: hypothetical protein VG710_09330 [Opitutus sp.]|nr:hypothetical protein [Opitutus sp.]